MPTGGDGDGLGAARGAQRVGGWLGVGGGEDVERLLFSLPAALGIKSNQL